MEAGSSGWLVPAGSVETLAAAMRAALFAPREQLVQMAKVGAKRVAQEHDVAREASKLAELFRRQIEGRVAERVGLRQLMRSDCGQ